LGRKRSVGRSLFYLPFVLLEFFACIWRPMELLSVIFGFKVSIALWGLSINFETERTMLIGFFA